MDGDKIPYMGHAYGDLLTTNKESKEALRDESKRYFLYKNIVIGV